MSSEATQSTNSPGKDTNEYLCLLECHAGSIEINSPNWSRDVNESMCQQTRITVSFMDYPELELCDEPDDENKRCCYSQDNPYYLCGKSFLFALPHQYVKQFSEDPVNPENFTLTIKVYDPDTSSNKKEGKDNYIGSTKIPLGDKLAEVLKTSSDIMNSPVAYATREEYQCKSQDGQVLGTIKPFLRISCFGKMIINRFHINPNQKLLSSELPDKKTDSLSPPSTIEPVYKDKYTTSRRCKKRSDDKCEKTAPPVVYQERIREKVVAPVETDTVALDQRRLENLMDVSKNMEWRDLFGYPRTEATSTAMSVSGEPMQDVEEPDLAYEEIRANVDGHTLYLKVLKPKKAKENVVEESLCETQTSKTTEEEIETSESITDEHRGSIRGKKGKDSIALMDADPTAKDLPVVKKTEKKPRADRGRRSELKGVDMALDSCKKKKTNRDASYSHYVTQGGKNVDVKPLTSHEKIPLNDPNKKEIFGINVTKKFGPNGVVRPKFILQILGPKTKEELQEDEKAAKEAEEKQKKEEEKRKSKETSSKETQCETKDFESSDIAGQRRRSSLLNPKTSNGNAKIKRGGKW